MIAVTRYRVPADGEAAFATTAKEILAVLAGLPGHRSGTLGRNADEPDLWVTVTEWDGAGFYRRALSEVRMLLIPLSAWAIDEPGAYEIMG